MLYIFETQYYNVVDSKFVNKLFSAYFYFSGVFKLNISTVALEIKTIVGIKCLKYFKIDLNNATLCNIIILTAKVIEIVSGIWGFRQPMFHFNLLCKSLNHNYTNCLSDIILTFPILQFKLNKMNPVGNFTLTVN